MSNYQPVRRRPNIRGFTLIELLVSLVVIGVLASISVPSLLSLLQRRHLDGAVSQMVDTFLMARSQAIVKNHEAFVSFAGNEDDWSYGLDDVASCDPATSGDCDINGSERVYRSSQWKNVSLAHTFADAEVIFEPRRGLVSDPAAVILTSPAGTVEVSLSPIGFISVCAVGAPFGRYGACAL